MLTVNMFLEILRETFFWKHWESYTTDEIKKGIENMEEEPFYIYINGSNPNREELTFENKEGQLTDTKKTNDTV